MLRRFDWPLAIALATLAYVVQLSEPASTRPASTRPALDVTKWVHTPHFQYKKRGCYCHSPDLVFFYLCTTAYALNFFFLFSSSGNLNSILHWFADKPTCHSINGEYSHEVTLEVNGPGQVEARYREGVTNICHEYRDWCVTYSGSITRRSTITTPSRQCIMLPRPRSWVLCHVYGCNGALEREGEGYSWLVGWWSDNNLAQRYQLISFDAQLRISFLLCLAQLPFVWLELKSSSLDTIHVARFFDLNGEEKVRWNGGSPSTHGLPDK